MTQDDHSIRAADTPRRSAKVIVLDESGDVLLFRGLDPDAPDEGTWWFPPGGGAEADETDEAAGLRELCEETGLRLESLGPPVATRRARFTLEGVPVVSDEVYFLVRVPRFELDLSHWTDAERRTIVEHRWWSREDLSQGTETVYPERLLSIVAANHRRVPRQDSP